MALLKVLLLLGVGVSVNSDVSLQKRIIGGHDCVHTERLYHVRVTGNNRTHMSLCGGSLIHSEWILTAAHCWKSEKRRINTVKLKVHPGTAKVRPSRIQRNHLAKFIGSKKHGIMLLKLQTPVTDIPVAKLPDCSNRPKIGDTVQLAGEGETKTGPHKLPSAIPRRLQCVDMKVAEVSHLLQEYGDVFSTAAPNKDACYGDVGSAVTFNGQIYGVISSSVPVHECQSTISVMDVCECMEWIKETTGFK